MVAGLNALERFGAFEVSVQPLAGAAARSLISAGGYKKLAFVS